MMKSSLLLVIGWTLFQANRCVHADAGSLFASSPQSAWGVTPPTMAPSMMPSSDTPTRRTSSGRGKKKKSKKQRRLRSERSNGSDFERKQGAKETSDPRSRSKKGTKKSKKKKMSKKHRRSGEASVVTGNHLKPETIEKRGVTKKKVKRKIKRRQKSSINLSSPPNSLPLKSESLDAAPVKRHRKKKKSKKKKKKRKSEIQCDISSMTQKPGIPGELHTTKKSRKTKKTRRKMKQASLSSSSSADLDDDSDLPLKAQVKPTKVQSKKRKRSHDKKKKKRKVKQPSTAQGVEIDLLSHSQREVKPSENEDGFMESEDSTIADYDASRLISSTNSSISEANDRETSIKERDPLFGQTLEDGSVGTEILDNSNETIVREADNTSTTELHTSLQSTSEEEQQHEMKDCKGENLEESNPKDEEIADPDASSFSAPDIQPEVVVGSPTLKGDSSVDVDFGTGDKSQFTETESLEAEENLDKIIEERQSSGAVDGTTVRDDEEKASFELQAESQDANQAGLSNDLMEDGENVDGEHVSSVSFSVALEDSDTHEQATFELKAVEVETIPHEGDSDAVAEMEVQTSNLEENNADRNDSPKDMLGKASVISQASESDSEGGGEDSIEEGSEGGTELAHLEPPIPESGTTVVGGESIQVGTDEEADKVSDDTVASSQAAKGSSGDDEPQEATKKLESLPESSMTQADADLQHGDFMEKIIDSLEAPISVASEEVVPVDENPDDEQTFDKAIESVPPELQPAVVLSSSPDESEDAFEDEYEPSLCDDNMSGDQSKPAESQDFAGHGGSADAISIRTPSDDVNDEEIGDDDRMTTQNVGAIEQTRNDSDPEEDASRSVEGVNQLKSDEKTSVANSTMAIEASVDAGDDKSNITASSGMQSPALVQDMEGKKNILKTVAKDEPIDSRRIDDVDSTSGVHSDKLDKKLEDVAASEEDLLHSSNDDQYDEDSDEDDDSDGSADFSNFNLSKDAVSSVRGGLGEVDYSPKNLASVDKSIGDSNEKYSPPEYVPANAQDQATKVTTPKKRLLPLVSEPFGLAKRIDTRSLLTSEDDDDSDITVSVVTWNLAEESPAEDEARFIRKFRRNGIARGSGSDLVLISGQECENIKPRRTEGRRSREYRRLMIKMLGKQYVPIALHLLGGIQFGLFAKRTYLKEIESVGIADVTCGIGNVFHNKGAIAAFVQVKARKPSSTSTGSNGPVRDKSLRMMFVTAHLAAHVKNSDSRDSDFWRISSELEAQAPEEFLPPKKDPLVVDENESHLFDSMDRVFFCGDLNYRVDLPRELTEETVIQNVERDPSTSVSSKEGSNKSWLKLLRHDQLIRTMAEKRAFPGFSEGKIAFAPTFKFDKGSEEYDTSHKQRIPAWTDRILFKPVGTRVLDYTCVADSQHSDHRPVHGTYRVSMLGRELPKKRPRQKKSKQRSKSDP